MVGENNGNAIADAIDHFLSKAVFHRCEEQQVIIRGGNDYILDFRILFVSGKR